MTLIKRFWQFLLVGFGLAETGYVSTHARVLQCSRVDINDLWTDTEREKVTKE